MGDQICLATLDHIRRPLTLVQDLCSQGEWRDAATPSEAEIIGVIPAYLQQTYTERWEGLEERLGSRSFSDFFSHLTAMYHKSSAHTTVLEDFRRHVAPVATDSGRSPLTSTMLPRK